MSKDRSNCKKKITIAETLTRVVISKNRSNNYAITITTTNDNDNNKNNTVVITVKAGLKWFSLVMHVF